LFGQIPDQYSAYIESGDINNPDFIDFVFRVFGKLGIKLGASLIFYLLVARPITSPYSRCSCGGRS
jgi:hypothetical protein